MANAIPASAAPKKTPKAPVEESKGPKIEYFGEGAESRTLACGFGDRRATITLHRHIWLPDLGSNQGHFD